jgi:hypothetical protein
LDAQQRFHELKAVYGIREFVRTGDIVDRSVMALMAAADPEGVLPTPEPESRFHHGDRVLVRSLSQFAIYNRALGDGQSVVLVDWFGRPCPTSVPDEDLLLQPKLESPKPARGKRRRRRRRHVVGHSNAGPTQLAN